MQHRDRFVWLALGATALVAMVFGHSLELWLEDRHLFGDVRAGYAHSAQTFAIQVAGLLFIAVMVVIARRILQFATHRNASADWLLPALHGIARSSFASIAIGVVGIQFLSLIIVELAEQRWSGFAGGGLSSIVGPGHATAIVVHALIGLIATFVLYRLARHVCAQSRAFLNVIVTFLRWAAPQVNHAAPAAIRASNTAATGPRRPVIALFFANRPPPQTSAFTA